MNFINQINQEKNFKQEMLQIIILIVKKNRKILNKKISEGVLMNLKKIIKRLKQKYLKNQQIRKYNNNNSHLLDLNYSQKINKKVSWSFK